MLAPESVRIVRATAATVVRHGEEITGRFYDRMFTAHPELLDLFNRGNQASGAQRQALAVSVAAVAAHFAGLKPVPLKAVVGRIAHKHASVGISPSQYVVVGRHLTAAIGEVLGEAATPDVLAAWDEVYWLFACLLVAEEARLYQVAGSDFGRPFHPHEVVAVDRDTEHVRTFHLRPVTGSGNPHRPGQYVSVAVELPGVGRQIRQYTISGAPGEETLRITVKRHRAAEGRPAGMVSTYLHEHVRVGDRLAVSPPFGDVHLPDGDGPLVLAGAGVGTTPIVAAVRHLARTGSTRPLTVVHADRSPAAHPLRADLFAAVAQLPAAELRLWYEAPAAIALPERTTAAPGLVEPDVIPADPGTRALLCGPLPFMREVRRSLLARGVPAANIQYEVFGPDAWLGDEQPEPARA
ncbi:globin domain-containing protein [Saccharothrix obliqua]|uniref:globin domain-containing protein n=1 Tax=Saccharothrix obliqua TaxID=2861747 RepID=UPI001C5E4096|nr:globin domain-containing protein [Saccharothrix obliqua]MBW4718564.1 hemin transporter [Saccharothrix obliqua]